MKYDVIYSIKAPTKSTQNGPEVFHFRTAPYNDLIHFSLTNRIRQTHIYNKSQLPVRQTLLYLLTINVDCLCEISTAALHSPKAA